MSTLSAATYGPTTTLGRNLAASTAAFLGIACIVFPSIQGVPLASVLYLMALGLILVGVFMINAFRWLPAVRRAKREVRVAGASGGFAFMQGNFSSISNNDVLYLGPGWVSTSADSLVVGFKRAVTDIGGSKSRRLIRMTDISDVYRTDSTSTAYGMLVLSIAGTGEIVSLMLTPKNGSGMRGPTREEIDSEILEIKSQIKG